MYRENEDIIINIKKDTGLTSVSMNSKLHKEQRLSVVSQLLLDHESNPFPTYIWPDGMEGVTFLM